LGLGDFKRKVMIFSVLIQLHYTQNNSLYKSNVARFQASAAM